MRIYIKVCVWDIYIYRMHIYIYMGVYVCVGGYKMLNVIYWSEKKLNLVI